MSVSHQETQIAARDCDASSSFYAVPNKIKLNLISDEVAQHRHKFVFFFGFGYRTREKAHRMDNYKNRMLGGNEYLNMSIDISCL